MAPEIYIKYSASVNDKVPQESAIAPESVCVCVCVCVWVKTVIVLQNVWLCYFAVFKKCRCTFMSKN